MDRRRFLQSTGKMGMGLAAVPAFASGLRDSQSVGRPDSSARGWRFPLNQGWRIATDPGNTGKSAGWFRTPPVNGMRVDIPSIIQQVYPGYHGVCWYFLDFEAEANPWKEGRSVLSFGAVDYLSKPADADEEKAG